MKKLLVIVNTLLLLIAVGFSIIKEEKNLKKDSFYLEIAPVDPRSLLQGDYMILDYVISTEIKEHDSNKGYIIVKLDKNNIGQYQRKSKKYTELKIKEVAIEYVKNSDIINLGINSFLFQEGRRRDFEKAKYVEVTNTGNGKLRIKNLLDNEFKIIK